MIPATRNIGAGAITLSTTDNILNIDTTGGAAIITLPSVASWFELKNKSGATYDPDGLRWTDVGGAAATNNITFLSAAGDLINGAASIVVNTNGAAGVITPTLDGSGSGINGWEFSLVGASGGAGEYDVFGTVLIDNIFVPSLNLVGLKKIYTPNYGDNQGYAINIGGTGTIVSTVNMPDLTEVYGNVIFGINASLTSFTAPSLTLVTEFFVISETNSLLATINISALTTILGEGIGISNTAITTLNLAALTTVGAGAEIVVANNALLTTITLNPALNCVYFVLQNNALTQANVDAILALVDAGGVTRVVIDYDTLVGTFAVGETITGGTSGATAVIVSDSGSHIVGNTVLGTFVTGETITGGTSTATANTTGVTLSLLQLDGGTNATPSAAGLVSKASLVAKGWNVTNN